MARFIEGDDRSQANLFPERLDDYVGPDNPVRFIEAFVDELELEGLGFKRCEAARTGRPGYEAATLLQIYIYGYLNRIASGRRLERECQRNVELMWLTRRLAPDHKTLCEFRKDNAKALVGVCREFVGVCRRLALLH
jgi:transposase